MEDYNELIQQRFKKLAEISAMGKRAYAGRFDVSTSAKALVDANINTSKEDVGAKRGSRSRVAGGSSRPELRQGRFRPSRRLWQDPGLFPRTRSAKSSTRFSKSSISATSSAPKGLCSGPRRTSSRSSIEDFEFLCQVASAAAGEVARADRRRDSATASATSTSSSTPRSSRCSCAQRGSSARIRELPRRAAATSRSRRR